MPRQYLNIKEKEQKIIRLYYDEGLTVREISENLKLTKRSIENAITRFNRKRETRSREPTQNPKTNQEKYL